RPSSAATFRSLKSAGSRLCHAPRGLRSSAFLNPKTPRESPPPNRALPRAFLRFARRYIPEETEMLDTHAPLTTNSQENTVVQFQRPASVGNVQPTNTVNSDSIETDRKHIADTVAAIADLRRTTNAAQNHLAAGKLFKDLHRRLATHDKDPKRIGWVRAF